MNILITGNLSSLAVPLAKELARNKHKVVLASSVAREIDTFENNNLVFHLIDPAASVFREAFDSYKFDVIVFLSTREEQFIEDNDAYVGQQLDGLRNSLELGRKGEIKWFLFVSSTEVYGHATDVSELAIPEPDSVNGHTLLVGEKYCKNYHSNYGLPVTILRLTNLYGSEERTGLLYELINEGKLRNEIVIPSSPEKLCSLLHIDDVIDFIKRAVDEVYFPDALVINLSSSKPFKFLSLAETLKKYFPVVTFDYDNVKVIFTRPVEVLNARKLYDWYDTHNALTEIEEYIEASSVVPLKELTSIQKIIKWASNNPEILKWSELLGGAVLVVYLSQLTGTLIQFQYIDFRLVYVVILGSLYGLQFGLIAASIMSLYVLYTWLNLGVDWKLLVYNVGNWFPFVLYLAVGLITGYNHDKTENIIVYEKKQYDLLMEKYSFLYEVFNEIREIKDQLRERLIGYRDSFGKIFTITKELDELQEHAVYFRALSILEELMDNKNIAIYSLDNNLTYARLEVHSANLGKKISKSLKLSDLPKVLDFIESGKIFQNTELLENYPAYIAPVLNNSYPFNVPVAIIVIWSANFDQYSIYYYNLFKVICGMIEASLVRATFFMDANYEKTYLPSTRMLNHDAFLDVLKIRVEMKKNKVSDFQLILLENKDIDTAKLYAKISDGIRAADIVGVLRNGACYILLSQSDKQSSLEVLERIQRLGIAGRLIDVDEIQIA